MATRKKHPRLPNGYGSIRYLGKHRKNPYAVHPPADIDGNRPPAICYVDDWMKGFVILTAYKAGTYTPGMEQSLELSPTDDLNQLSSRILADYSRIKGIDNPSDPTFSEVYADFFADKYPPGNGYSKSTVYATKCAFNNCKPLHDKKFRSLTSADLQKILDNCPKKHATLELIKLLFKQMYQFAEGRSLCEKRYDQFVKIRQKDDDESGVPFTDAELQILWEHVSDPSIELLLILCYSGWRISELYTLDIDLDARTYAGGLKTKAGKGRIVPIHSAILPLVKRRLACYGVLLPVTTDFYRKTLYTTLKSLNLLYISDGTSNNPLPDPLPKHTPHDCRHTFSRLCEKYDVRENDRKRMLGHAFEDVTNKIYGHREVEDLRKEIEKIKVDICDFTVTNVPLQ